MEDIRELSFTAKGKIRGHTHISQMMKLKLTQRNAPIKTGRGCPHADLHVSGREERGAPASADPLMLWGVCSHCFVSLGLG